MGSNRNCTTIWITFCIFSWFNVQASSQSNPLNSFLYDYAFKTMHRPRTGKLYEVIPPVNLSGIEVSIIRLRTHSLWRNGANFSAVEIPATMLPSPFTKRVDIVYQNLGNWSSSYYNVPNYTFVTPVIGFLAYDSSTSSINHHLVELKTRGDNPMIVRFQNVSEDARMKCVRFSLNGTLEFSNVTAKSSCETTSEGHFSIVMPRKNRVLKWWMVGIPAGIVGLIMVLVLGVAGFMLFEWRRVRKMVKKSENGEVLDTTWVGNSRMPSASEIEIQILLQLMKNAVLRPSSTSETQTQIQEDFEFIQLVSRTGKAVQIPSVSEFESPKLKMPLKADFASVV